MGAEGMAKLEVLGCKQCGWDATFASLAGKMNALEIAAAADGPRDVDRMQGGSEAAEALDDLIAENAGNDWHHVDELEDVVAERCRCELGERARQEALWGSMLQGELEEYDVDTVPL